MYTCANCTIHACVKSESERDKLPKNCPVREENIIAENLKKYEAEETKDFYINSCYIEKEGYGNWTRVKETLVFCRKLGYKKIGLAFCEGLSSEARIMDRILRRNGFEVVSVMCKNGGQAKETVGIPREKKLNPDEFEPMCNPIGQAELLNKENTQFNIVMGLCVGHDSLFYKYSKAPVTTLVVKDRVLAHNPVGALYCADSYYESKLDIN